jgi:hypothetical protein
MTSHQLIFKDRKIGPWTVPTIELEGAALSLQQHVSGTIINSITDGQQGRDRQQDWKVSVASGVKEVRGAAAWNPAGNFAISLGLSFHLPSHGNQKNLDVENFIKPVIDALAAGLFCDPGQDPQEIAEWRYDDSNFRTLLIHRLDDATRSDEEGVAISVSSGPRF